MAVRAVRAGAGRGPGAAWEARGGGAGPSGVSWTQGNVRLYHSKRRAPGWTGARGEIPEDGVEDVVPPAGWDERSQRRLAVRVVARDAGLSEEETGGMLAGLERVAPGLAPRFGRMKVADLARLATRVDDVARRMVELRLLFPTADLNQLVSSRPSVLLEPAVDLEATVARVRAALDSPRVHPADVDRVCQAHPYFLDADVVEGAVAEVARLFPKEDAARRLLNEPALLLQVQSGPDIIEYDNGSAAQLKESLRGGPRAAPKGW